jgi:hypothetical protein
VVNLIKYEREREREGGREMQQKLTNRIWAPEFLATTPSP